MKQFRSLIVILSLATTVLVVYTSCKKEVNSSRDIPKGQQQVSIKLSDNPVNFNAVFVDIQTVAVQVIPDSCLNRFHDDNDHDGNDDHDHDHPSRCSTWDTLNIHPGIYNLLNLANGTDTILASGLTVSGKITKIRLTLGSQNSVVIDSVSYPLTLWNNDPDVTISIRGEDVDMISPSNLQFWLDFDAGRSIVRIANNHFVLRPFLRVWVPAHTASIQGFVTPESAQAVVAAISNGDTLVAFPEHRNGFFKIRGITSTSGDVFINATANGYQDTTITGIQLEPGKVTDIGTVHLHQ